MRHRLAGLLVLVLFSAMVPRCTEPAAPPGSVDTTVNCTTPVRVCPGGDRKSVV